MRPRTLTTRRTSRPRLAAAAATGLLLALLALTGCSGGGVQDASSKAAGGSGTTSGGGAADLAAPGEPAPTARARTVVRTQAVVRTGSVVMTARRVDKVLGEVHDLVVGMGGSVDRAETEHDRQGRTTRSEVVVRVPVARFDTALSAVKRLGKVEHSSDDAKDVTTEKIDVDQRVATLENSLEDLHRYQRRAKDVTELLKFEDMITQRQSELQSLKAQQSYLDDQTTMSTITLSLSTPERYVPPPDALEDAGFLSGLKAGWHSLGDVVVVGLTVLGALLPFLAAALVLGVPVLLGVRALLRRRAAPAPPTAPAS